MGGYSLLQGIFLTKGLNLDILHCRQILYHLSQQGRLLSSGVCLNSCILSWWCYLTISSSAAPLLLFPSVFPSISVFSSESVLHIRWPKYWSFSFSIGPSNEYSGLISFRIWLIWSPCYPRDFEESSPAPQFESIDSSVLSLLYGPTVTSIHDYWKNHSFDCTCIYIAESLCCIPATNKTL